MKPNLSMISRIAEKSNHHQHRHAVLVVRGGQIVATGYNHNEIHAEVNGLSKIWPNRRKGLKVYSFRIRRDGSLGLAKPCVECEAFLKANGVKQVWYSTNEGTIELMKL